MKAALRRMIVRAAPTCALWRQDWQRDELYFVLWPSWRIHAFEYLEAIRCR